MKSLLRLPRRHQIWIEKYVLSSAYCYAESLYATASLTFDVLGRSVPGALVECGVAAGVHPAVMHYCTRFMGQARGVWLMDSFRGVPHMTEADLRPSEDRHDIQDPSGVLHVVSSGTVEASGLAAHSVKTVCNNMRRWGASDEHVHYVEGWFQDTLPSTDTGTIALLRLDADLYESTKVCMEHLYPRVSVGGYVILHDWHYPGVRKAVAEHLGREPDLTVVDEPCDEPFTTFWRKDEP